MSQQEHTRNVDLETDGKFLCYDQRKVDDTTVSVKSLEGSDIGLTVSAEDAMTTLRLEKSEAMDLAQIVPQAVSKSDEQTDD
jgi:hypothetical protein